MSKDEIQTSLRMSRELLKRLKQYALDHDISLATVVREACEEYLKKVKKWVINLQYAQIVFIVKRSIISIQDKKTMTIIVKSLVANVCNILRNKKWVRLIIIIIITKISIQCLAFMDVVFRFTGMH